MYEMGKSNEMSGSGGGKGRGRPECACVLTKTIHFIAAHGKDSPMPIIINTYNYYYIQFPKFSL